MGLILNVTPITDTAQMPLKKGTLQFLQNAYNINFFHVLQSLSATGTVFNSTTPYVLYGCRNTGVYPNYNISAGVVLYGLQIYAVDAASFTVTGSDVPVMNIVTNQYTTNADPVTLTDGSTVNIHNINSMTITAGASGSGDVNWSNCIFDEFSINAERINRQTADAALQTEIDNIYDVWQGITLNSSNVTATGGTISPITGTLRYKIIGKTVLIRFNFTGTLGTTPSAVVIDCSSFLFTDFFNDSNNLVFIDGASTSAVGKIVADGSSTDLIITSLSGVNLLNGSHFFNGSITTEIG
jgi:hypothetical protein